MYADITYPPSVLPMNLSQPDKDKHTDFTSEHSLEQLSLYLAPSSHSKKYL